MIPKPDVWFWKPQQHWFGWKTLIPFTYGHDEYARRVLVFGWSVTGRILIAVWGCGDPECERDAAPRKATLERARRARAVTERGQG